MRQRDAFRGASRSGRVQNNCRCVGWQVNALSGSRRGCSKGKEGPTARLCITGDRKNRQSFTKCHKALAVKWSSDNDARATMLEERDNLGRRILHVERD